MKLRKKQRQQLIILALIVLLPVLLFLLTRTQVFRSNASNINTVEAESAVLSGNVGVGSDSSASNGQYLVFGQTTTTTSTTPAATSTIAPTQPAASGNIQVNFTSPIQTLNPLVWGMDESGYPNGPVLPTDPTEQQRFKTLGITLIRMGLKYTTSGDPTSKIICEGSGCNTTPTGDDWINAIKAIGAEPIVIVPINTTDAANLVKHFNKDTNNPVKYWIFGNEPTIDPTTYANDFNAAYDAMKAIDPTILIGGPASPSFDCCAISGSYTPSMYTFMQISGSRTDFIDFHKYGQGGSTTKDDATLFADTPVYEQNITTLRNFIQSMQPSRASQIGIEVGEWQLDWDHIDPRFETEYNTVWNASALGYILRAGAIALPYATKNLDLGYVTEGSYQISGHNTDDTMPAYHGIGMFTGEGLFRKFGTTMVTATSSISNIEVFASTNNKNIVVINKDPSATQNATIGLGGYTSGTADVWQKNQSIDAFAPPSKLGTLTITNSSFTYSFPPYSVTTFVLN